jgi:rod shape-determining protein MreD
MRFLPGRQLVLILAVIVWLELCVLPLFSISFVKPDLFFVFLVFYAFRVSWKHVLVVAFLLGLCKDLLTNSFFGIETAAYAGGAILIQFLAMQFDRDKRLIQWGGVFILSLVSLIFYVLLECAISGSPLGSLTQLVGRLIFISVYTTVIAIALFPVMERWLRPLLVGRQYELF